MRNLYFSHSLYKHVGRLLYQKGKAEWIKKFFINTSNSRKVQKWSQSRDQGTKRALKGNGIQVGKLGQTARGGGHKIEGS